MKFRTTLVLLIVAFGIGSYIWFYEQKQLSTDEREQKGKLLFSLKADDIDRIELVGEKGTIVCARDRDGEWNIEKPLNYRADKSPLRSICSRIEALNSERIIRGAEVDDKALEEFGLKKPRITARFRTRGLDTAFAIGEDTPLGSSAYAMIVGQKDVYLVNKSIYTVLNKELKDLRDRGVVEFEPADLDRVQITHGGKSLELVQEGRAWRISKPLQASADPDKVSGMLRKIKNLRVRDFTSDAPGSLTQYGLDSPSYEIAIWGKKEQPSKTLLIGREAEKNVVYAKRGGSDTVFTVSNDFLKDISRKPEELRDAKVTRLAQGSIDEISIRSGDKKLVLGRSGEKWEVREPEKRDAEESVARDLLQKVTGLAATDFATAKAGELDRYGLGKEAMEITLKPKSGDAETVLVGKKFDGSKKVYVTRAKSDEILTVAADFLNECSLDPLRYARKQVLDFNSGDVKRLTLARSHGPKVVCERGDEKTWTVLDPERRAADADAIHTILSNLCRLRAMEFIAKAGKELKAYGLDTPSCEISLDLEKAGTPQTITLMIGDKARGGDFYAKLADGDVVFTIPPYVEENIRKDLAAGDRPAAPPAGGEKK